MNIRKDIATCQVASILPINFHGEKHGEEKQKAKTLNNRTAWEQRIPNTRRNDRHGKKKERTNGSKGGNGEKKTGRNTEQPPLRHSTTNQSPGDPGMLELPIRSSTRFRNKNGMRLLVGRASIWPFAPLLNTKSPELSIEVKVKYSPPLGQSWAAGPVTGLRRLMEWGRSSITFHGNPAAGPFFFMVCSPQKPNSWVKMNDAK